MQALVLVAAMVPALTGQSGNSQVTGLWTAEFKGQTFVRLELRAEGGTLAGTMSAGNIEVDDKGDLRHVTAAAPGEAKSVFDISQQRATVTFSTKDDHDTDRFELRMLDFHRAELRFLFTDEFRKELAAGGIPVPKPILLTRR